MLFIGFIIGAVVGAVQAAAGAAISTGLSAVGLGGRLAYGTYLNTVRAIVLLGRGAGAAGAAGGGLGGFGGGSFSGGGASGSWGGNTASNNQTPTPTPTNQAQTPDELPSSGASGTQITSGNDFMEGEYDPLVITSTRGNNIDWSNIGGIGTGIASGTHLMPQIEIIYPKSTNAGKILNTGRVLQPAITPNPAWMQGGHLIPRPGVINTLPQDAIMSGIQASGQIRVEDDALTWEEIEQLFKENLDAFLDKLREVRKVFADVAPYMVMAFSPGFAPYGLAGLMLIPEARRRFVKLIEVVNQLHEDPLTEMMLAMLGMYPAFGDIVDLVNGLLDLTKGKVGSALLSFASAVPVVGNATTITRIGAVAKKIAASRKLLKSAARLRKRAWSLYKSKFSSKTRKHIFGGDINNAGRASGVQMSTCRWRSHL
ncbi:MAG: hypothetical protein JNK66_01510 [Chitinophagales bacterium]|nr:hypothetical protein [Chitinophagales bacterium]